MPLNPASYPAKSGLVNEVLEGQLSQLFGKLAAPVEITCILGSDDKSAEMAALLVHICSLPGRIPPWMRRWMLRCCPPPQWAMPGWSSTASPAAERSQPSPPPS